MGSDPRGKYNAKRNDSRAEHGHLPALIRSLKPRAHQRAPHAPSQGESSAIALPSASAAAPSVMPPSKAAVNRTAFRTVLNAAEATVPAAAERREATSAFSPDTRTNGLAPGNRPELAGLIACSKHLHRR